MDVVALICRSLEFPSDKLCGDISRVLKPGGTVLLSLSSQSVSKVSELSLCAYFFHGEIVWGCELSFYLNCRKNPSMTASYYWLDSLIHSHLKLATLSWLVFHPHALDFAHCLPPQDHIIPLSIFFSFLISNCDKFFFYK